MEWNVRYWVLVASSVCICLLWACCRLEAGVASAASPSVLSSWLSDPPMKPSALGDGSSLISPGRVDSSVALSAGPGGAVDVPILMYHYLTSADSPPTPYHVTQGLFEQQMEALAVYGYETVSLADFMDYRSGAASPPAHPVIITFDDGHRSVYSIARPILEDRSMQATLFVTTDFMAESDYAGRDWLQWDPEISTLYAGGFPVESHSVTHPRLTEIPLDQAEQEILASRLDIESRLGGQVEFFCYPGGYGAYEPEIRALVQEAGYRGAVAAWPGGIANTITSDIWALPRVAISETHSLELDPIHPERFYMRRLDPSFPLPFIAVDAVRFTHADGTSGSCFTPGEVVSVTVATTNVGAAVDAQMTFALDDDAEHDAPYYSESIVVHLAPGVTETVIMLATLAEDLDLGQHFYSVRFQDEYAVLGFMDSGWQPALRMAATCYRSYLPTMLHKTVNVSR